MLLVKVGTLKAIRVNFNRVGRRGTCCASVIADTSIWIEPF